MFAMSKLKNKRCFFGGRLLQLLYIQNMLKINIVYDAYADYSEIVGRTYETEKVVINLAITGMIRDGKRLSELYNLQEHIEEEKIKILIYVQRIKRF